MSTQSLNELKNLEITLQELSAGTPARMSEDSAKSLAKKATMYPGSAWDNYLLVEKLVDSAIIPTKNNAADAGYDLYAFEPCTIPAWGKAIVSTQISVGLPVGTYGRIASRSGLSAKNDLEVGAGVIDYNYRGEVKVILRNFSDVAYQVQRGDRIAQLILEQYKNCMIKQVSKISDIVGASARGAAGFGSSGQ